MWLAALRRFSLLVLVCCVATAAASLLVGVLIGARIERALALGFYLAGCFVILGGFFVGNRGPARVKSESPGAMTVPFAFFGVRKMRWATLREQMDTINTSALFVTLGLILILVGFAFDAQHSLI